MYPSYLFGIESICESEIVWMKVFSDVIPVIIKPIVMLKLCCRRRALKEQEYMDDKKLVESESTSDITKSHHSSHHVNHVNNSMYQHIEKKTHHHIIEGDTDSGAGEMYSLDDLPRVMHLNDEEVQSIGSSLLDAEERALETSSGDLGVGSSTTSTSVGRYNDRHDSRHDRHDRRKSSGAMLHPEDYGGRKMSNDRRASAVNAARRMSAMHGGGPNYNNQHSSYEMSRYNDRRISVLSDASSGLGPPPQESTTLRRSISAFGEITVMPVGDNEDDDLRIAVEEEIIK